MTDENGGETAGDVETTGENGDETAGDVETTGENGDKTVQDIGTTAGDEDGRDDRDSYRLEERKLQAKLEAGSITESEYARLTALRFGKDPESFDFEDAATLYDLTPAELRAEIEWLSENSR